MALFCQVGIDDVLVPPGLKVVTLDGIGHRPGRVPLEVHRLPAVGPNAAGHEHKP